MIAAVRTHLLLVLATLVGATIRLYDLGARSLWYDEIISIRIAERPVGEILRARLHINASDGMIDQLYTNNPPLHLLLLHAINAVTQSESAYRLPFALAGIVTIPITYRAIRRLFNHQIALGSAILMAFSPLHVFYSQEARPTALLVLFSLLSLGSLLDAVATGKRRDWLSFALFGLLGIWSSYFALTLVTPTLGVVFLILLYRAWREHGRDRAISTLWRGTVAFAVVSLGAIPLFADLLATAEMNGAQSSHSPRPEVLIFSVTIMMLTAIPMPGDTIVGFVMLLLTFGGIVGLLRGRNERNAIALVWSLLPIAMITTIKSNHVLELRYILFIMPMVFAIILNALFGFAQQLGNHGRRVASSLLQVGAVATFVVLSLFSQNVSAEGQFEDGITLKADWMNTVQEYARSATPESCLVYMDAKAHAAFGTIEHYVERFRPGACAIDVRDPRLLDAIENHPDLWWAVGTQWYTDETIQALNDEFSADSRISEHYLVLLIHPEPDAAAGASDLRADRFLRRAITVAEPVTASVEVVLPSLREGFVNLTALRCGQAAPAQTIVSLLGDYTQLNLISNDLDWGRARGRLERGDIDGARVFGILLSGRAPGDPTVYDFIAEVETLAGTESAVGYAYVADALRSELTPQADTALRTC